MFWMSTLMSMSMCRSFSNDFRPIGLCHDRRALRVVMIMVTSAEVGSASGPEVYVQKLRASAVCRCTESRRVRTEMVSFKCVPVVPPILT